MQAIKDDVVPVLPDGPGCYDDQRSEAFMEEGWSGERASGPPFDELGLAVWGCNRQSAPRENFVLGDTRKHTAGEDVVQGFVILVAELASGGVREPAACQAIDSPASILRS